MKERHLEREFLGLPQSWNECWYGHQKSNLFLHVSNAALHPSPDFGSLNLHALCDWPKIISKLHISPLIIKLKFCATVSSYLVPDNPHSTIFTAFARNTRRRKQEPLKPDRLKSYLPAFLFPFTHLILFLPLSSLYFRGTKNRTNTSNFPSLLYAKYLLVRKQRTNNNNKKFSMRWMTQKTLGIHSPL